MKLWDKGTESSQITDRFTVGNDREMDKRLAPYDVRGTIAHVTMLAHTGIISLPESKELVKELGKILDEVRADGFEIPSEFEDIHSYVEYLLTERLGAVGKKVHTGRSRNDQVLVDLHLYFSDALAEVKDKVVTLAEILLDLATEYKSVLMPGYTHTQVAMPSSFGLWFGAYAESLADDLVFVRSARQIVDQNPLGSAAGFGSSFPIDRKMTTELLGFSRLKYNSIAAQMSRGRSEMAVATALSFIATTLARLSSDIVLYISQNFGFISFPAELTTGSSIMPHKKNPDIFELTRAKCNTISTVPQTIRAITGNLISGYHRDYQLLKEPVFRALDDMNDCLDIMISALPRIEVSEEILQAPIYRHIYSVEAVNRLVLEGMSFRDAYRHVGDSIENGSFRKPESLGHTHEGSIGNLCIQEIRDKIREFSKQ